MANAPLRPCTMPACPNPANYRGRCEAHASQAARQRYTHSRGVYRSDGGVWRKLQRLLLAEEPLCRECATLGFVEAARQVDHVIPISERPELRLYRPNLEALCHRHHSAKTRDEVNGRPPSRFYQEQRAKVLEALAAENGLGAGYGV